MKKVINKEILKKIVNETVDRILNEGFSEWIEKNETDNIKLKKYQSVYDFVVYLHKFIMEHKLNKYGIKQVAILFSKTHIKDNSIIMSFNNFDYNAFKEEYDKYISYCKNEEEVQKRFLCDIPNVVLVISKDSELFKYISSLVDDNGIYKGLFKCNVDANIAKLYINIKETLDNADEFFKIFE